MKLKLPLNPPLLSIVANTRGGCGKTTFSTALIDLMVLNNIKVRIFQVDEQAQLEKLVGQQVISLLPNLADVGASARAMTAPFAPLYEACEQASRSGEAIIVDVGANMVPAIGKWLTLVDLQEDLTAWKMPVVIYVPAVREAAAVQGAIETLIALRQALPSALQVFVENQRDGMLGNVTPQLELARIIRESLEPLLKNCVRIQMPAVDGDSWPAFQGAGLRFIKALAIPPVEAATLLGETVADAKIMRGHILKFVRVMHREINKIISLPKGGV